MPSFRLAELLCRSVLVLLFAALATLAFFSIAPTAHAATIDLINPVGGGTYYAGQTITISWISSSSGVDGVSIGASIDGTNFTGIASYQPATGQYSYTVPGGYSSTNAKIRVTAWLNEVEVAVDTSAPFTADPNPAPVARTIDLTAPNGGVTYPAGQVVAVTWSSSTTGAASGDVVDIQYASNGSTYTTIASNKPLSGTYYWTVPNTATSAGRMRVRLWSASAIVATDTSTSAIKVSVPTRAIDLTTPNGGDTYTAGEAVTVTWSSGTTNALAADFAEVMYTLDGTNYISAATNLPITGSYTWTAPSADSSAAKIKVRLWSAGTNVASDVSTSTFTVKKPLPVSDDYSGEMGISPVTGLSEKINNVYVGDYLRGASFDAVYYIDVGNVRRPFMDSQTYMTYQTNFDNVRVVTDATLSTLTFGQPVLPKAGVVLVKIASVNKVYAVGTNADGKSELRWITSEEVAIANYGATWADYVIDIPVTLFPKFVMGAEVSTDEDPDTSIMRTRITVNK